jgi:hypothetical protein
MLYLELLLFVPEQTKSKIKGKNQSQKPHPLRTSTPQRMGRPGLHTMQGHPSMKQQVCFS